MEDRPAAAWFHRGQARVVFDITVTDGAVQRVTFRADADVLAQVVAATAQIDAGQEPAGPVTPDRPASSRRCTPTMRGTAPRGGDPL